MFQANIRIAALSLSAVLGLPHVQMRALAEQTVGGSSPAAKQAYAAAAAFQNEGVLELAVEDWRRFLQQFPSDALAAEAQYNLGACSFKLGRYLEAADAFEAVAAKYPHFDRTQASLLNQGIASYRAAIASQDKKQFDDAATALDRFVKTYPNSSDAPAALALRAQSYLGAGHQDEATACWLELIDKYPSAPQHAETLYVIGKSLLDRKQPDQARKAFARLEREHASSPLLGMARFELGEYEYHQRKNFAIAAREYTAARTLTSDSQLAEKSAFKLGWAYYQQHDYNSAQQALVELIDKWPSSRFAADAQLLVGECLFQLGKFDAAAPRFARSIVSKVSSSELNALALLRSGQCAAQLRQWNDSLKFLDRLIGEAPSSPYRDEAVLYRADALTHLGQADEALRQYQKLATNLASPLAMQAQFMIGEVYARQNDHREAVRSFYRIIRGSEAEQYPSSQPWKPAATYQAGRSFESLHNIDQAKRLYSEVVEKYPHSEPAAAAKERIAVLNRDK